MTTFSSIYKGMTGLLAFSNSLNTLSQNVSNLNTPGYKGKDAFFSELGSEFDGSGSNGTYSVDTGGGQGVQVTGYFTRFAQGTIQQTGNNTDMAIDGNGLFILRNNGSEWYTRDGQFQLDNNGYLVDPTSGYRVAGIDSSGKLIDIQIDQSATSPAVPTTKVDVNATLASSATTGTRVPPDSSATSTSSTTTPSSNKKVTVDVIDGYGQTTQVELAFYKENGSNWRVEFLDKNGAALANPHIIQYNGLGVPLLDSQTYSLAFETYEYVNDSVIGKDLTLTQPVTITNGDLSTATAFKATLDNAQLIARNGEAITYETSGNYYFDSQGYLNDSSGKRVAARTSTGALEDVNIAKDLSMNFQATSSVSFNGVLNSNAAVGDRYPPDSANDIPFDIVASDGTTQHLFLAFQKTATDEWSVILRDASGNSQTQTQTVKFVSVSGLSEFPLVSTNQQINASFDFGSGNTQNFVLDFSGSGGKPALVEKVDGTNAINYLTEDGYGAGTISNITLTDNGTLHYQYTNGQVATGQQLAVVNRSGHPVSNVTFDFSGTKISDTATTSTLSIADSNGVTTGDFMAFAFGTDGKITANYSNGKTSDIGQVALAQVANDKNLLPVGDSMFKVRDGTNVVYGSPKQGAFGTLKGKSIELSNVDLSHEFADIIIVQRGFQASSQILNTTNKIIEELYNSVRGQ